MSVESQTDFANTFRICPSKLAAVEGSQPELGWETQADAADTAETQGFDIGCEAKCRGALERKFLGITVPAVLGGGPVCGNGR